MIEVDSLVRQGIVYPRWFPDFGQGHGYPIFDFFPPFGYLLTELPELVVRNLPLAIQISMAASMIVSAWGMYPLAREIGAGRFASLATAGVYLYFPYHLQDLYTRGGMPELWAMAGLPWLAWAQLRATQSPNVFRIGLAGLLAAGEIGTHNILAAFILPACLVVSLVLSPPLKRRFVVTSASCTAAGVLLAIGYWLPAVVEAPLTHVKELAGDWLPDHTFPPTDLLDGGFFAPYGPKVFKMTAFEAAVLLALICLLLWHGRIARRRLPALGLVALTLATIFGLTKWSVPLWTNVPLMGYIQFPWRLLTLVGFFTATMLALVTREKRWAWIPAAALAAAMGVGSLKQVPDQRFLTPPPLDARTLQTQEYGSALDGVAIESEYQPQTSSPDLMKASQGKRLPDDDTSAPPIQVSNLALEPVGLHATVSATQPSRIRLQTLLFPGWQAHLDGQSLPLRPATPAGFIEAEIPPGAHRLDVTYGGTVLEGVTGLVSGLAFFGWLAWLLRKRPLALGGLVALVLACAAVLAHRSSVPVRSDSWQASPNQTLVAVGGPRLTERGIQADLWWQFGAPREASFDFVLKDDKGREVQRVPARQAATIPYEYIAANELLERRYTIGGVVDVPAGTYSLLAGDHPLGSITLPGPASSPHQLDAAFHDGAVLENYTVDRVQERPGLSVDDIGGRADATTFPGDFLRVSLMWRSRNIIDQNYVGFVHLVDGNGKEWASHDNQPNATLQATSSWVPGSAISDQYLLKLPDAIPPGMYRLEVGLYHIDEHGYHFLPLGSGGNSVLFGAVKVRPRSAPAEITSPVASWQDGISLAAWRQRRQGSDLALTFDWAATANPARDYTLFVHLSDGSGKVVAQADDPPQRGLYPTRLWDSGDRLSDVHLVHAAPPGRYRLSIGWYRPDTGQRLQLTIGGNELNLGEVSVGE